MNAFRQPWSIDKFYAEWVRLYDTLSDDARRSMHGEIAGWTVRPLISVVMLVENPDLRQLSAVVQSICAQLYPHWELCICGDASRHEGTHDELQSITQQDHKVCLLLCEVSGDICPNMNTTLALVSGEFIAILDCNGVLLEHALIWVIKEIIEQPETQLIFSDEDKIAADGRRFGVYFKPDWNPALMLSRNAFGYLDLFRKSLVGKVGGLRSNFDGSQDHDLAFRCVWETRPERILARIELSKRHRRLRKKVIRENFCAKSRKTSFSCVRDNSRSRELSG